VGKLVIGVVDAEDASLRVLAGDLEARYEAH
jgi:hypothetical protein